MAYYQFDLTFVNLGALPEDADSIRVAAITFDAVSFQSIPASGDLTITLDTLGDPPFIPAEDLDPSDLVWFEVLVYSGGSVVVGAYMLGPYAAGDEGTEISGP